jgi:capsular polysaccharide biosynthesis protein/Mrp family chromosome partitioning ATPase
VDLSGYVAVLRRWSVTLIASAAVAGFVAFMIATRIPPTYAANSQLIVGPINTDNNTLDAAQQLVQTYAQLVTTDAILDTVIEGLGLDVSKQALRENVSATPDSVTRILTIEVLAGDPNTAAAIANALPTALDEVTSEGQIRPEGEVTVTNVAQADPIPVQPQVGLIVLLAMVAGLIASLALVLIIDYLGNTITGEDNLTELTQAPFFGSVEPARRFRPGPVQPLISEAEPNSRAALAYRLIGSKISAADPAGDLRTLVVLGTDEHEGSGEVAANLAAVLTRAGRSVRLVDANDEDREITRLFDLEGTIALGELVKGRDDLLAEMVYRRAPGMGVVPRPAGFDHRLMEGDRATRVLERVASNVDLVILNTAPIHRSASALLWARDADGVILVARRDKTKRENVTFTVESLRLLGTRIIGTTLHGGTRWPRGRASKRKRAASRADSSHAPTTSSAGGRRAEPVASHSERAAK